MLMHVDLNRYCEWALSQRGLFGVMLAPAASETADIHRGDFLLCDTLLDADARLASSQSDSGTLAGNQENFHDVFYGIALEHRAAGQTHDIWIATVGRFPILCAVDNGSKPGMLLGMAENAAGTLLRDNLLVEVATRNLAVGVQLEAGGAGSIPTPRWVEIRSTVVFGGHQTLI